MGSVPPALAGGTKHATRELIDEPPADAGGTDCFGSVEKRRQRPNLLRHAQGASVSLYESPVLSYHPTTMRKLELLLVLAAIVVSVTASANRLLSAVPTASAQPGVAQAHTLCGTGARGSLRCPGQRA